MPNIKSWRTTILGIAALVSAVGLLASTLTAQLDGDPATVPNWDAAWTVIAAALSGLGLIFARDNKTSDEQAGAGVKKTKTEV